MIDALPIADFLPRRAGLLRLLPWLAGATLLAAHAGAMAACSDLATLRLADTQVISAQVTPAGPMTFNDANNKPVTMTLPAFCRVKARVGATLGVEVWLPEQGWNQQFLGVGSGGFGGEVQMGALAQGLKDGYAVTSNDTGHAGSGRAWMQNRRQVRLWGHDGTHLSTAPAKAIVAAFYGKPHAKAYFAGCSTGGAQAMAEAQFFPADYDGIVAADPGMSYARLMLSFIWGLKAASAHPDSKLGPAQLLTLHRAVLAQCDARDGVADGLLEHPPACDFDPKVLLCQPGADASAGQCLTAHQIDTVNAIHAGPRNARTGASIYPGFAWGSEASLAEPPVNPYSFGWLAIQGPLAEIFAIPLLREMVYQNPAWNWHHFDWDADVADLERRIGADITATNPDLRAFRAGGGKLLMHQGWGDPLNGHALPIEYRQQVIDRFAASGSANARADVDGFLKLFMAPGMSHCTGGPGPNSFDALGALRLWVEHGSAPLRIVASKSGRAEVPGGAAVMTRPLCAYPAVARWNGSGATDDAANFSCTTAPEATP